MMGTILTNILFLSIGHGIKCYNGALSAKTELTCPGSINQCLTTKSTAAGTVLSCAPAAGTLGCSTTSGIETCYCNTDLCNTGSSSTFKCYVGNGNNKKETECSNTEQCIKADSNGQSVYSCGTNVKQETGCKDVTNLGHACVCDGSLCNAAPVPIQAFSFASLILIAMIFSLSF